MLQEHIDQIHAIAAGLPAGLLVKVSDFFEQPDWEAMPRGTRSEVGRWVSEAVERGELDDLAFDHVDSRNHRIYEKRRRAD